MGQWASEFGVDRRRFLHWEKQMGEEAIDRIRRGVVSLPPRPGQREGEREEDAAAAAPAAKVAFRQKRARLYFFYPFVHVFFFNQSQTLINEANPKHSNLSHSRVDTR